MQLNTHSVYLYNPRLAWLAAIFETKIRAIYLVPILTLYITNRRDKKRQGVYLYNPRQIRDTAINRQIDGGDTFTLNIYKSKGGLFVYLFIYLLSNPELARPRFFRQDCLFLTL